jgi:hypothetical protein
VEKSSFQEMRVFNTEVWFFLIASILFNTFIFSAISKKSSFYYILVALCGLILAQGTRRISKIRKRFAICFLVLVIFMTSFYKATILDKIMNEPKDWCETLECFAKSHKKFIVPTDHYYYQAMKNSQDQSMKKIFELTKKVRFINYDIHDIYDILSGSTNSIIDSHSNEMLLTFQKFATVPNDWYVAAKQDYSLRVELVRKKHPKAEQIRRKINECLEFGIIDRWSERTTQLFGLITFALIKSVYIDDDQMMGKLYDILNHHKDVISLNDYKSTFKILISGAIIACIVLMIERIFNLIKFLFVLFSIMKNKI